MSDLQQVATSLSGLFGAISAILLSRRAGLQGWIEPTAYVLFLTFGVVGFGLTLAEHWR